MLARYLLVLSLLSLFCHARETVLCENGVTLPIVVPAEMTPAEKTASEELAAYLHKITGSVFRMEKSDQFKGEKAVFLRRADLGSEEWAFMTEKGSLIISGGHPRGILYGVYHFLEDVLGVRWWSPWAETVPSMKTIRLPDLQRRGKPVFQSRELYDMPEPTREMSAFLARNRMSTNLVEYGGQMIFGRPANCHTLYANFGKEGILKLYEEHPEYFPLIRGKRVFDRNRPHGGAQTQLCLTNPALRKHYMETLREHIAKDRKKAEKAGLQPPMYYAIDQNDSYDGFCECPACDAIVKREGGKSGLMLDFVNYLAAELQNDAPEAIFLMMAIHSTEKPPANMRVRPNVGIRLCDTTSNTRKPWSAEVNAKHRRNLEAWSKICDKIVVWDYSIHYGSEANINLPAPTIRTFAPDLRFLAAHGGIGIFFEHEQVVGADMRDMKVWIEIKLAENPDLDPEKLIRDFTDGFYGAAGRKIREYRNLLEAHAGRKQAFLSWFPRLKDFTYLDETFLPRAAHLLDEAESAVRTDPVLLRRVRHARLSLDRALLLRYPVLRKQYAKRRMTDAFPLPEWNSLLKRYRETWLAEMAVRAGKSMPEESAALSKFCNMLEKRRDLPVPAAFKHYPDDSVLVYPAAMFQRWNNYMRMGKDPESTTGEAIRANVADAFNHPSVYHREDRFRIPFPWKIHPLVGKKILEGSTPVSSPMPRGYHWYRIAEKVPLESGSRLELFCGIGMDLDGAVSDNSERGQLYDVWASIKFTGPDYTKNGNPTRENAVFIDQVVVIRRTSNTQKTME